MKPEHWMDYSPGAPRRCRLWRRVLSWAQGTLEDVDAAPKWTLTERGMNGGRFGWSVTGRAWWNWNAAIFAGFGTMAVVMVAAYPGVHTSVALAGRWGYRSLALGCGDVSGAARSGGRERHIGPLVFAGVDKGGISPWRRVLSCVSGVTPWGWS